MVLIPAEHVVNGFKYASLEEIYEERNRFIEFIREYESGAFTGKEYDDCIPSYSDQYNNCKKIVEGLNQLIDLKQGHVTEGTENTLVKDLQKIIKFYKEGLLTDDEFAAMKKKLIEEK